MGQVTINKYYPIALLYFFFNAFLLPIGLTYTTLLTPLLLYWVLLYPAGWRVLLFFILAVPFALIHFLNGVDPLIYLKSTLLYFSIFVFCLAFYQFLINCTTLRSLYRFILLFNAFMVLLAFVALLSPKLKDIFWYYNQITEGVMTLRLRLLTYEPSYYATLLLPIALYYYLKASILKLPSPWVTLALVTIPFLLAFSFGGLMGLLLAYVLTMLYGYSRVFSRTSSLYLVMAGALAVVAFIGLVILFPNNVIVVRINNILDGQDTSFRGRTFESFWLGWKIAEKKSLLFGVGPGQFRQVGLEIFRSLYDLPHATTEQVVIPNSLGDTLAAFGLAGLCLRLMLEIYFFFKTRVTDNFYRLSLFLFMFIYQFTGSFISNLAEYVIWILAFHRGIFPEFDKINFPLRRARSILFKSKLQA